MHVYTCFFYCCLLHFYWLSSFSAPLSKRCLVVILRVRFSMYWNLRNRGTIPALFAQIVTKQPDKPALIYEPTGEVGTHWVSQINQPYCCQNLSHFHIHFIPGLEFQEAAGAMSRRGSLGSGTGVGWRRCGGLVHGKPAFTCGSLVGSCYDWRRGCIYQLQPSTAIITALCQRVWRSSNGVRDRDERRYGIIVE